MPADCVAVLLAAGAGSRFAGPGHKLSASIPGTGPDATSATVIERALDQALAADIGPVVVVTGAVADIVPQRLHPLVTVRHNPRWSHGQSTSLRVGLDTAADWGARCVVVGLADQPFVVAAAWRAVAAADTPIAVATYAGRRGNPVKLDAVVWPLLEEHAATDPDAGARNLMRVRPDLVGEVPCPGSPDDVDTEEDLRRWQRS